MHEAMSVSLTYLEQWPLETVAGVTTVDGILCTASSAFRQCNGVPGKKKKKKKHSVITMVRLIRLTCLTTLQLLSDDTGKHSRDTQDPKSPRTRIAAVHLFKEGLHYIHRIDNYSKKLRSLLLQRLTYSHATRNTEYRKSQGILHWKRKNLR